MAKKENRTLKAKSEISPIQRTTGTTRNTAIRKMRAAANARSKVKARKASKAKTLGQPLPKGIADVNRSEGIRLFKLAGRPTREQFILVYGERGPKMTWDQRAAAGVPANRFQVALAAKQSER